MANNYCTLAQLTALYDNRLSGQLSNDVGTRTPNSDNLQLLLDTAASELDSALAGRWALPLPVVDAILTRWVATRALKFLYQRRSDTPQGVKADLEWSDRWIDMLMDGRVVLPGSPRALTIMLDSSWTDKGTSQFDNLPAGYGGINTLFETSKGKLGP